MTMKSILGTGRLRYIRDGESPFLDQAACNGCGMCIQVCPHGVFTMDGRKARIQDSDACMECGACRKNCPTGAISARSGVGCTAAIINGILRGTAPDCGCGSGNTDKAGCGTGSGCCS